MKASVAFLALALSGATMAAPFNSNGTYVFPAGSGLPKPSQSSSDVPLPNPFAPSSTSLLPWGTPTGTPSGTPATSTPLGTPSGTPPFGGEPAVLKFKRADSAIPTGLASLASEAESALGALASLAPKKRAYSFTPPALPSSTATPSGTPISVPTGAPSFTPSAIPSATGFSLFGIPLA
jgi:hypothetical protein